MKNLLLDDFGSSGGSCYNTDNISSQKCLAYAAIDQLDAELRDINLKIHDDPELGYEEHHAHDNIADLLESLGLSVTRHAFGLPTSFQSEYGSGGRLIVFNAEYDALPEIGHACGHNLIATAAIAAYAGVVRSMQSNSIPGRIRLLGTPAEEGMGGKIKLIEAGAYRTVDACLMVHPGPSSPGAGADAYARSLANVKFRAIFTGKPAVSSYHSVYQF